MDVLLKVNKYKNLCNIVISPKIWNLYYKAKISKSVLYFHFLIIFNNI